MSSSTASTSTNIPKPKLNPTPSGANAASNSNSVALDGLISKHAFAEDLDRSLSAIKREEHEKRVRALRKELDYIANTNWQFDKVHATAEQPADPLAKL